jgi:predicted sulfurtransferase
MGVVVACGIRVVDPRARDADAKSPPNGVSDPVRASAVPESDEAVARIEVATAYARWKADSAVFIDTRGAEAFLVGHIAGATLMPLSEVEADPGVARRSLPSAKLYVFYCT